MYCVVLGFKEVDHRVALELYCAASEDKNIVILYDKNGKWTDFPEIKCVQKPYAKSKASGMDKFYKFRSK